MNFEAIIKALQGATKDLEDFNNEPLAVELLEIEEIEPIQLDWATIEELAELD